MCMRNIFKIVFVLLETVSYHVEEKKYCVYFNVYLSILTCFCDVRANIILHSYIKNTLAHKQVLI